MSDEHTALIPRLTVDFDTDPVKLHTIVLQCTRDKGSPEDLDIEIDMERYQTIMPSLFMLIARHTEFDLVTKALMEADCPFKEFPLIVNDSLMDFNDFSIKVLRQAITNQYHDNDPTIEPMPQVHQMHEIYRVLKDMGDWCGDMNWTPKFLTWIHSNNENGILN